MKGERTSKLQPSTYFEWKSHPCTSCSLTRCITKPQERIVDYYVDPETPTSARFLFAILNAPVLREAIIGCTILLSVLCVIALRAPSRVEDNRTQALSEFTDDPLHFKPPA
jgi:hypothetical protein